MYFFVLFLLYRYINKKEQMGVNSYINDKFATQPKSGSILERYGLYGQKHAELGENTQKSVNTATDEINKAGLVAGPVVEKAIKEISSFPRFQWYYIEYICWREKINRLYAASLRERATDTPKIDWWGPLGNSKSELQEKSNEILANPTNIFVWAALQVFSRKLNEAKTLLAQCLQNAEAIRTSPPTSRAVNIDDNRDLLGPFDRRLDRAVLSNIVNGFETVVPFDTRYQQAGTIGFEIEEKLLQEQRSSMGENADKIIQQHKDRKLRMENDDFFIGVPAINNAYAIVKLYGSKGGEFLTDQKNRRAWYEVDTSQKDEPGFSKSPTTTSIIFWGNGDPYGRTPYQFSDFAFSKYWNKIANNRMITLRRFAAPIVDNMRFPGMDGVHSIGQPAPTSQQIEKKNNTDSDPLTGDVINGGNEGVLENGSGKVVEFPPMATAVTYFGEGTDNKLSEMLNFSTGVEWDEAKADMWSTQPETTPDNESGPAGLYGNLSKYARMFNVARGDFNADAVMNKGALPPDPYENGPYENRILGPVNRIQAVKKRAPGIKFENTIDLNFDYVARPIGGVNTKAAILDIISNFLVIGSASAVFWGGQHRFMGDPQKYPFIGGDKGIQQWYRGDPIAWGKTTITDFSEGLVDIGESLGDIAGKFFNSLFSGGGANDIFGGLKKIFTGKNAISNTVKDFAARKSAGKIPYLMGLKALLIGEPVGEWHVTIGNPLNPIAMIGNLICTGVDVQLGDELGPDDFPTEVRLTVHLEHGMARDRDAIESIFNRGMGRIYDLPDNFRGSADGETKVDKKTGAAPKTGRNPIYYKVPIADSTTVGGKFGKSKVVENSLNGSVSVWNRAEFSSISPLENLAFVRGDITNRAAFRSGGWISQKALQ